MAGYSGISLPKKLGIKEHTRVALLHVPAEIESELRGPLSACQILRDGRGRLDFVFLFVKSKVELRQRFSRFRKRLASAGMLWVAWPKQSSGVACDLNENVVRRMGLQIGLVDVKVCALNEIWSGLKFVMRVKDRAGRA
jgi:hypothetical protein